MAGAARRIIGVSDLQHIVSDIAASMAGEEVRGEVADYIPELARVPAGRFGLAVATRDGEIAAAGDADHAFSTQSVSKVFTLTLALGRLGDALWNRVGREPSGNAFNSIVQLEHERGIPRNPFINAGALVVADALLGTGEPREALGSILQFVRFVAGDDDIVIDDKVARSETLHGDLNAALTSYMRAFGTVHNATEKVLGVYFHHCAIAMTCRQLAAAGRYLAFSGTVPHLGSRVVTAERARRINALMLTCGQYDGSGDFAFRVGLPAKSGVGGGILAVAPGQASIAVWSPGLNAQGNSLLGIRALEMLARRMNWSVFGRDERAAAGGR